MIFIAIVSESSDRTNGPAATKSLIEIAEPDGKAFLLG
jgi:hypothetical protein